ncbi:MAG: futalosine hydrolase [Thermodesulfobacteria bacterium]|nr:futalosine hydrolase [Thermodesulfobacteriota bacterium]
MLILVPTALEARILQEMGLDVELVGMGPVEAAVRAFSILKECRYGPVVLTGIGGAYPDSGLEIGSLAVANVEFFGDLGVCYQLVEGDFTEGLDVEKSCSLRHPVLEKVLCLLEEEGFEVAFGPFVTVCCATRDPVRARFLATRHQGALVENMEGFAVARVAREMGVPLVEIRAVSNLLAEPERPWQIERALEEVGKVLRCLVERF